MEFANNNYFFQTMVNDYDSGRLTWLGNIEYICYNSTFCGPQCVYFYKFFN